MCGLYFRLQAVLVFIAVVFAGSALAKDAKLTSEEIIAKHLASVGTPEAIKAAESRTVRGSVSFGSVAGKHIEGGAELSSQTGTLKCQFEFGQTNYPREKFVFDGSAVSVAMVDQGVRSPLGVFLFGQQSILKEGLWGGTLSTAWPLYDLSRTTPKLNYDGLRKVRGQKLHRLVYTPKRGDGSLSIELYFEPETFRHVLSLYTIHTSSLEPERQAFQQKSGVGGVDNRRMSDRELAEESKILLEERFSDFKTVDGLTFPSRWDVRYDVYPATKTRELQWDVTFTGVVK